MDSALPKPNFKIWRLARLAPWLIPVALFLECCLRPIAEPDLFFYYALIERYLRDGVWPTIDPFLYTLPNDDLMSLHQWLGYWIYYLPYRWFGWAGPICLKTSVVGMFFILPLLPYWKRHRPINPLYPLAWTLAIFIAHHRFRERVSLFGDLFTLLLITGLLWSSHRRWFWYALPCLFLAWAQIHPSYPLGWIILFAYFLTRRHGATTRLQLGSLIACLLLPCLNPLGIEGVLYPFTFTATIEPYLRQYVVEWLPLTDSRLFSYYYLYVTFVTLIPFMAWTLWRAGAQIRAFEWFLFALGVALNIKSVRFGLLAQGIFLVLLTSTDLKCMPWWPSRQTWRIVGEGVLLALSVWIAILKLQRSSSLNMPFATRFAVESGYFPEAAVNGLSELKPKMHIFNSFGFGGYLAWRWQGNPQIFFHGFSTNFKFYEDNYNHPQEGEKELNEVIARYNIGVFLLSRLANDANFVDLLSKNPEWQKLRQDDVSVIFVKRDPRVFN